MTALLPIFPLKTVLFPGMMLPLQILEERYHQMIQDCLDSDGEFGICLIADGEEVGAPAVPREVGTRCRISGLARLPDGRMNIVVQGKERFRISELHDDRPYLTAEVEGYSDAQEECAEVVDEARDLMGRLIRKLAGDSTEVAAALPEDPQALSFLISAAIPTDVGMRQCLLEMQRTADRLNLQMALIRQAVEAAPEVAQGPVRVTPFRFDATRFSPN